MKKARAIGLSFLLAAAVAVPMAATTVAWAAEAEPASTAQPAAAGIIEVNGNAYNSLQDALAAVPADKPANIKLLDNVTIPDGMKLTLSTDVTIDLNGFTLTSLDGADRPIYVKHTGSITILGTVAGSSVKIANSASYGLLEAELGADITIKGGTFTGTTSNGCLFRTIKDEKTAPGLASKVLLEDLTVDTSSAVFATKGTIPPANGIDLTVKGGVYKGAGQGGGSKLFYIDTIDRVPALFENVTATNAGGMPVIEIAGADVTFNNCTFAVEGTNANNFSDTAVFVGYRGKATLNGGSYTSAGHGAYIGTSGGEIVVNSGTVQGDKGSIQADADGSSYSGAVAKVQINGGTIEGNIGGTTHGAGTSDIAVTGGTVKGDFVLKQNGADGKTYVAVSGGTFSKPVAPEHCAPGFEPVTEPNANGDYVVCKHEWDPGLAFDANGHWQFCTLCGEKGEVVAHVAAAELSGVVEATCGTDGYTGDKVCKDCGYVMEKGAVVPASGKHTADKWTTNATDHWHVCTTCDKPFDIANHTFGDWKVTKEATATAAGERAHECTVCGKVVTEAIPALGAPQGNTGDNLPQTNDSAMILFAGAALVAMAAAAAGIFALKRRQQ